MSKNLYIAEKPSVARSFADALKENMRSYDGYMESDQSVVTWCFGHLVTMSYPEIYDENLKRWSLDTIPFIPDTFRYEIIPSAAKQFQIVSNLLNRSDVVTIYICTDSGREGEYIYRLVDQMAGVDQNKARKRVWIDSQTEEEILRGIREAKDWSFYDHLSDAAYLRAQEDYLMGINFSRALTLKYGYQVRSFLNRDKGAIAVGRVMTCVLGFVVAREREIRSFVKTPFYRIMGNFGVEDRSFQAEWKAVEGSRYFQSPKLYKENGFKEKTDAEALIEALNSLAKQEPPVLPILNSIDRKKESKNPPLLYNLAELQNECSKIFKISPDQTLTIVQELYEKKLTTYPRTDARVLSTAVAKEITKNLNGLKGYGIAASFADEILQKESYKGLEKTRYVNDKQITDHYAIIPTGQGLGALRTLNPTSAMVYELIVRRFLAIFYPPAVYLKIQASVLLGEESFFANFKVLENEGYLPVMAYSFKKDKSASNSTVENSPTSEKAEGAEEDNDENEKCDSKLLEILKAIKPGAELSLEGFEVKEGETSPPKRYTSGSIILTMENAGQFIEDEELRSQIKGSGIGTSATRAEILEKLQRNEYLNLNKKTQVLTPTLMGEMIYDVVNYSIAALLNPSLTASWEKGLSMVAGGEITAEEYTTKLDNFVAGKTNLVKASNRRYELARAFEYTKTFYAGDSKKAASEKTSKKKNS